MHLPGTADATMTHRTYKKTKERERGNFNHKDMYNLAIMLCFLNTRYI